MSEAVVAKRYADALFQLAKEKGSLDEVQAQLTEVKKAVADNPRFFQVIENPGLSTEKKLAVIQDVFSNVNAFVLNTLKLLTERGRLPILEEMADAFTDLYNEENGKAVVTVQSVKPLEASEVARLEEIFKLQLHKQEVIIENKVDPSILGGIKAKVGNTIYDGTVSGKLNRLRNQIVSATK